MVFLFKILIQMRFLSTDRAIWIYAFILFQGEYRMDGNNLLICASTEGESKYMLFSSPSVNLVE